MESKKRGRGRPQKGEKVSAGNVTEGAKVDGSVDRRDRRFVGGYVRKEFPVHGVFLGKVVSFAAGLYKVLYEDGDCEEVDYDELCRVAVDKREFDADTMSRKNRLDQLVYSGKLVPVTTSTRTRRKASVADHSLGDESSRSGLSSEPESLVVDRVEEIMSDDGRTNTKYKRQKVMSRRPGPLVEDKSTVSRIELHSKGSTHLEIGWQTPLEKTTSLPSSPRGPLVDDGRPTLLDGTTEHCLDKEAESYSDSCDSDDPVEGHGSLVDSKAIHPPQPLPPSSSDIDVPLEAVGYLFSVYNFLRSFSHQLFLSPFTFEEFVASLNCISANSIFNSVHVSLLRALKRHLEALSSDGDVLALRILRYLDWSFVDAFTWPVYVVQYVLVSGAISKMNLKAGTDHLVGEYYALSVFTKLRILQILCDEVIASAELRAELDMREKKEIVVDGGVDPSCPAENRLAAAYSEQLKNSLMSPISCINPSQPALNLSSSSNLLGNKVDLPVVDSETAKDGNSDECCLCSMDGMLVCCDGCPSAYHSRCVGINKALLPEGSWFCPECIVNKMGSTSSRIGRGLSGAATFGIDPYGRAFFGTCNYLLVLEDSSNQETTCRYYNAYDIPAVLRALCSSEQNLPIYSDICKGIIQHWGILPEAKALNVINASPNSHSLGQKEVVNGTQMFSIAAKENGSVLHKTEANSCPSNVSQSHSTCGRLPDHQDVSHASGDYGSFALQKTELQDIKKCDGGTSERPAGEDSEASRVRICETFDNSSLGSNPACCSTKEYENLNVYPATGVSVNMPSDAFQQGEQHLCGRSTSTESATCVSGIRQQPTDAKEDDANAKLVMIGGSYQKVDFIPYAYTNQYILGDIAASAAANLSVMAAEDKKISSNSTSNPKNFASANISLQMKAFSGVANNFFWPSFEKKPMDIPRERCGWCASCKSYISNSNNRKGCLLNAAASNPLRGIGRILGGGPRPAKNSTGHIGAYILHIEEGLRALMCGSWLASNHRRQWRKQVEQASTCRELKMHLLMFEENIRLVAFSGAWIKQGDDWLSEVSAADKCVIPVRQTQKLGPGRRNRRSLGTSGRTSDFVEPSSNDFIWWRGGKLSKQIFNKGLLPSILVNKAARQGGLRRILGIFYSENSEIPRRSQRVAWRSAVEVVKSTCHLALQVRYLDAHIRWNDLYRPEVSPDMKGTHLDYSTFRYAVLREKVVENNEIRYMLDFGIQKDIPARVMKNVTKTDQGQDGKSKFWFSESHVPLYLIREYEEKIPLTCAKKSVLHKHRRHSITLHKDIFSYLIQKLDMPERFSCGRCQNDVSPKVAVKCRYCQGSFHKDCVLVTPVIGEQSEPAFTCYTCYCSEQDKQNNGCKDYLMGSKVEGQLNGLRPLNYQQMGPYLYPCAPTSLESVEARQEVPDTKPYQKGIKKRGDGTEYGLILKKNKALECSTDFWSKNVLSSRNQCVDRSLRPMCVACHKPYNPDLLYVRCEYCGRWFHGDAVNLLEDQTNDVVGFKCCRCRKKCMPICPYSDQDKKKVTRNMRRKRGSNVQCLEPHEVEMVPSPSVYGNMFTVDGSEAEDDPFLFSLEKVEAVMEQSMPQTGSIWRNSEPLYEIPQKLPVRRCHIKEKHEYVDDSRLVLDEKKENMEVESPLQLEWQFSSTGHCNNEEMMLGFNDRLVSCETANLDNTQYEPQTYFSFTELLPSEDDQLEDMPYMSMDDAIGTCINEDEGSLLGMSFDSSFTLAECGICACSDPVPDVSCAKCGFFVHGTCLPFSTEDGWTCGSCEN